MDILHILILSSAKAEILQWILEPGNCIPLISLSKQTFLINGSKHNTYYKGDKLQSCFTEREILTGSDIKLFRITLEVQYFKPINQIWFKIIFI